MKNLILTISIASGVVASASIGLADDAGRHDGKRTQITFRGTVVRTHARGKRHQHHTVKYRLDREQKRRFDSRSLARRWARYVRSLGADASLCKIDGRIFVCYQMRGSRARRFYTRSLARSFEQRLESIGFKARVTRF